MGMWTFNSDRHLTRSIRLNVLPPKAEFFVSKRPSYLEGLKGAKSYMTMPGKPEIETKESLAQE